MQNCADRARAKIQALAAQYMDNASAPALAKMRELLPAPQACNFDGDKDAQAFWLGCVGAWLACRIDQRPTVIVFMQSTIDRLERYAKG